MIKIKRVSDIYSKDFFLVDVLEGVSKTRSLILETDTNACPVLDNGILVGVVTVKDLLKAHPNRIIADAMNRELVTVPLEMPLWQVQGIFDKTGLDVLVVQEKEQICGVLPRNLLDIELGPHTDLLTGLYKSDYIYYQGARLLEKGQETCIVFIDLNNFGIIDKTYGHTIGDTILVEVSSLLKENIPLESFLCRYGGDEFVILLPEYLDQGVSFAYKLAETVDRHSFPRGIKVSISAGVIGGRRKHERIVDPWNTIENLMNIASLHSTEAKKGNTILSIADFQDLNEIA